MVSGTFVDKHFWLRSVGKRSGDPVVSGTFADKHFGLRSVGKRSGDPVVSGTFAEDDGREV